ncbi:MAG: DUF2786 domain-containing protein [Deltaproteobacteria bacterium]|nr:DUF2786 domain-containing protein [Deltaproteobacteria bacterium]
MRSQSTAQAWNDATPRSAQPEIERAALHEIADAWRDINWRHFRSAMEEPSFGLVDATSFHGRWSHRYRHIEIARDLVHNHPWVSVEEVLKHEMAHQFADEILRASDETDHGPAFQAACHRLGIPATASGPLTSAPSSVEEEDAAQSKISRLLSLATSPNQHEAEAAMLAARRLMLKYNIDNAPKPRTYTFRQLGRPHQRVSEGMRVLARILSEHFFVEVLWVPTYVVQTQKRASRLEIVGTTSNLAIAEYVHDYLVHTTDELWRQRRRDGQAKGDRRAFIAGAMYGFLEKLAAEKQDIQQDRALVWVKDAELDAFFRRRHPRLTQVRSAGHRRTATFHEGRAAGRKIVLKKGVEATQNPRGFLLGAGAKRS